MGLDMGRCLRPLSTVPEYFVRYYHVFFTETQDREFTTTSQKIAWSSSPRGLAGLALLGAWRWVISRGTETIFIRSTLRRAQLLSSKHGGNYVSDELEEV